MQIFSAEHMDTMADRTKLENVLRECHRDDYREEYCYDGFYLMLMIDEEPRENRKNFWQIIGSDGSKHDVPGHLFKKSFTYCKPTYEQFQFMIQSFKLGEKS